MHNATDNTSPDSRGALLDGNQKLRVRVPGNIASQGLIAIDPGVNGAFALSDRDGNVQLHNWVGPRVAYDIIRKNSTLQPLVIVEKVSASGGQGPKQAFTFGKNVGHWEGILTANGFKHTQLVSPLSWQRGIPGLHGKQRASRKRALFNFANQNFILDEQYNVDPKNADALLIFLWAQHHWDSLTHGVFE